MEEWRKVNAEMESKNLQPLDKNRGGFVIVWGCMSAQSLRNVHFIDGIMNQDIYLNIMKTHLIANAKRMGIKDSFVFTQIRILNINILNIY
jgi:hypothetical protein